LWKFVKNGGDQIRVVSVITNPRNYA
jgi:hypothetical protein